jgi:hypothetical protein
MASAGQMTGVRGVFLVAAELTRQGFIVSTTSRSAFGADLLITDQQCRKAWSVQVKTNGNPAKFWLLSAKAETIQSNSHAYVFVNLRGERPAQYVAVLSKQVAREMKTVERSTGSVWHSFSYAFDPTGKADSVGWELFGDPMGPSSR